MKREERRMEPLRYLATLITKIEKLSRIIELEEEQVADWLARAAVLEESIVRGMGMAERREVEKKIQLCIQESERVEELLSGEKKELEELEEARAGLEQAGFKIW